MVKMAVFAPMPSAIVARAARVNPGLLARRRTAYRRSPSTAHPHVRTSGSNTKGPVHPFVSLTAGKPRLRIDPCTVRHQGSAVKYQVTGIRDQGLRRLCGVRERVRLSRLVALVAAWCCRCRSSAAPTKDSGCSTACPGRRSRRPRRRPERRLAASGAAGLGALSRRLRLVRLVRWSRADEPSRGDGDHPGAEHAPNTTT